MEILADCSQNRQSAKINFTPKFPAIRYISTFLYLLNQMHFICMCTVYKSRRSSNCFHISMQVIWDRLYSTGSARDKGTLYQFRNALRPTAVTRDVSTTVHEVEDLLQVSDLLYALIYTSVMCYIEY